MLLRTLLIFLLSCLVLGLKVMAKDEMTPWLSCSTSFDSGIISTLDYEPAIKELSQKFSKSRSFKTFEKRGEFLGDLCRFYLLTRQIDNSDFSVDSILSSEDLLVEHQRDLKREILKGDYLSWLTLMITEAKIVQKKFRKDYSLFATKYLEQTADSFEVIPRDELESFQVERVCQEVRLLQPLYKKETALLKMSKLALSITQNFFEKDMPENGFLGFGVSKEKKLFTHMQSWKIAERVLSKQFIRSDEEALLNFPWIGELFIEMDAQKRNSMLLNKIEQQYGCKE